MKKNLLVLPLFAAIGLGLTLTGHNLVGHWNASYGNGPKGHMVFRSNGTFEATFNGQHWKVGGKYKVDGNTVAFADSSCGLRYWGKYKVTWLSDDSARATVMEDTCSGRRGNGDGAVMVRTKK